VTVNRLKKHALLFAIALAIIAAAYSIAVAVNATDFNFPSPAVSSTVFVGLIAVCLSLPLGGFAVLLMIRRRWRRVWMEADPQTRVGLAAYLAIEASAALAAWIAFLLVATHR
jgi:hypothetical protein